MLIVLFLCTRMCSNFLFFSSSLSLSKAVRILNGVVGSAVKTNHAGGNGGGIAYQDAPTGLLHVSAEIIAGNSAGE